MARPDGRAPYQIRPLAIQRNYLDFAEGSAFVEWGRTRVLCSASVDERVPGWLVGAGQGWLTAEYGMLPKSTKERVQRPAPGGRANGRSLEIQRLIGRALRAVIDLKAVGERTIWIDCDVIQADGGTRTAAVTGAMVALHDALSLLKEGGVLDKWPLHGLVAATSVGICNGVPVVDLCYEEDRDASVDMNVVMTADDRFIEIQGTAEGDPFTHEQHLALLDLAKRGIDAVLTVQKKTLGLA